MGKDNYYAAYKVSVEQAKSPSPGPGNANVIKKGVLYIGARFQNNLLLNQNLYKKLGFRSKDLLNPLNPNNKPPSIVLLSSQSAGQRLSVYRLFSLVLVPKDNQTIPPYDKK